MPSQVLKLMLIQRLAPKPCQVMNFPVSNKVLQVTVERDSKKPLITYFGGVSLRWNKWVEIDDNRASKIWNGRSEVVQRLLAQECVLCGATDNIEVHHIRK